MTLEELKKKIEDSIISNSILIFDCEKHGDFIAFQYIDAIKNIKNAKIDQIEDIEDFIVNSKKSDDLFDDLIEDNTIYLYICDKFDISNQLLLQRNNTIIVVKEKISAEAASAFKSNIVKIPQLENWQITDYLYSMLPNINHDRLDWLQKICNNDIYRINSEIDRLKIFDAYNQNDMMKSFYYDGIYSDLTTYTMLNLINAFQKRDISEIKAVYLNIRDLYSSDMLFYTLLCSTFRNLIQVRLSQNPTEQSTGLTSKQIYAISKLPKIYTEEQLVNIYIMLTDISQQIRLGTIKTGKFLVDYLIVKILSA